MAVDVGLVELQPADGSEGQPALSVAEVGQERGDTLRWVVVRSRARRHEGVDLHPLEIARAERDQILVFAELYAGKPLHALSAAREEAALGLEVHLERIANSPVLELPGVIPRPLHERVGSERYDAARLRVPAIGGELRRLTNVGARHETKRGPEIPADGGVVDHVVERARVPTEIRRVSFVTEVGAAEFLRLRHCRLALHEPL